MDPLEPVRFVKHGCVCFESDDAVVYVDPYKVPDDAHDAAAHTMPTIPGTMPSTVRSAAARQKLRPRGSSFRFVASISIITPAATVAILNTRSARMLNSSIAPPKIFSAADRMPMP